MLARKQILSHPSGNPVETPLLVPAFSSKGLPIVKKKKSGVADAFKATREYLTYSMLLSAYDIHYKFIPKPSSAITEIVFIDSGGYETEDYHDLSATFRHSHPTKECRNEHRLLHLPSVHTTIFL